MFPNGKGGNARAGKTPETLELLQADGKRKRAVKKARKPQEKVEEESDESRREV